MINHINKMFNRVEIVFEWQLFYEKINKQNVDAITIQVKSIFAKVPIKENVA